MKTKYAPIMLIASVIAFSTSVPANAAGYKNVANAAKKACKKPSRNKYKNLVCSSVRSYDRAAWEGYRYYANRKGKSDPGRYPGFRR